MTLRPSRPSYRRRGAGEGVVTVFVADEQNEHPVAAARWGTLAEQVLAAEGVQGEAELSVLFVDRDTIVTLNHDFMDVEGPTDVLSFPIDGELAPSGRWPDEGGPGPDRDLPDPDDLPLLIGDVVICPAVAAANAPGHAGSFDDEIALLVVHGILHLLGRDHADPAEEAAMQARERELLEQFHGTPARDPWTS
jgi:probable rRNA maturation factor